MVNSKKEGEKEIEKKEKRNLIRKKYNSVVQKARTYLLQLSFSCIVYSLFIFYYTGSVIIIA